jgi:EAL domain-containing protein (putative c-di-GMP-specific phosphodiesterase class I)/GGDEF domain-containing protein
MAALEKISRKKGAAAPLFILSFRRRDELMQAAEKGGWLPIAARRSKGAESRFLASGASIVLVDARDALHEAREAVRTLAEAVEANGAALLLLLSDEDIGELGSFFEDGATHFLVAPFAVDELIQSLRFAARHAQRVGGAERSLPRPGEEGGAVSWRWQPGSSTVELSPALARKAGLGEEEGRRIKLIDLFRKLDAEGRKAARIAVDHLLATGRPTAFAHGDVEGGARLAHHLRVEGEGAHILGRTETIGSPAAAFQSRDSLTGARDGRAARAWIAQHLSDPLAPNPSLVMLLLGITRFDAINGAFGRAAGDAVLQAVVRRIERLVDPDGQRRLVARLAGTQFAILLAAPTSVSEGRFLAGQLVEALGRPFASGDHVITLGGRATVVAGHYGDNGPALVRRASKLLAEAKTGEGGAVRVEQAGTKEAYATGDQLEVDLRRALDAGDIEMLFQPINAVSDGRIVGAEALARWRHPDFGELGATTLFNVAERSDYLVELSDHVQRRVFEAAAAWPESLASVRLSVNVTAVDIARPAFAAHFLKMIDRSGFARDRVTVEVTEGGLIEDLNAAATLLAELREGGLRIAIDDFGTGYSSLAYLKALPLDYIKIDKRLCEDITGSPRDRIVVRSVIDMARSLGLTVIAEGVETQEQLDLLAQEGCNLYQGFLCSPPVDAQTLAALVASAG